MLNGTQDDTKDSSVTLLFISLQIKKRLSIFDIKTWPVYIFSYPIQEFLLIHIPLMVSSSLDREAPLQSKYSCDCSILSTDKFVESLERRIEGRAH